MIRIKLSTILGARRIKMNQIAEATGLSTSTIFFLYHERAKRIDFATLNKLCECLKCQPGDLLEYVPDEE